MKKLDLTVVRHLLHQLAEPSGLEVNTQKFLLEILRELRPTMIHTFDNSRSILVVYDSKKEGNTLLFRADFDAVHVDESIDITYASLTDGVSHKCGHDGHAAILLGVAEKLSLNPLKNGKVLLFFQAAEESGQGAGQLLDTHVLDLYKPDKVFALHNIPGEPVGTVICRPKSFTCSVISCDIELKGHTSHAAEPLKAVCPYTAAKNITDKLLLMNRYDINRDDFSLVTLVEFRVGEQAYGVTAGNGVLRFTLRAQSDALLKQIQSAVASIVTDEVKQEAGLTAMIEWKEYFAASANHDEVVVQIRNAAEKCALPYVEKDVPFSWGEDFGLLTQHYPGALFGLGAGVHQPPLHHPNFDFPDELLPLGVKMFMELCSIGKLS